MSPRELQKLERKAVADLIALERQTVRTREFLAFVRGQLAKATEEALHNREHLATVNGMNSEHALAISKTQRGKDPKFRAAMHAAGFTQNNLADRLHISSASLTRYRDKRPVPKAIADKVKLLTGFDGSWPGGIVE